ncbi:DNA-binding transcriptional LysR family regulator [Roseimicrobium gellanilyticum]|uniref:DNA-binding transcriptional LysR family regulator n=1 Tax=Roseimicrobium gellanilyticum TaxID=748857 RepID=A0A366H7L8_9BACT|nr:LysR substrate-binding domain-containing protein [Roseimicrobium gellanilyticum]RBP37300.1 DNA-binding transcriptional LysR family regulator [Roseimicrobium gellanilyticum]
MLTPMELRHLKYFVAVAQEENITRAAAKLHVAQPALSRQIRDLELELGVPLFEHNARSVRLTEAGRVFLKNARSTLKQAELATQSVREFAMGHQGEIHIGYAASLTVELLPRAIKLFQEKHPRVHVQIHDLSTEGMLAGLRDGTLHAALLVRPSTPALGGLIYEEAIYFRPGVALPTSHPLGGLDSILPVHLAGESILAYSQSDYPEYHVWLKGILKKVRPSPKIVAEYDSSTSLIAAVESGCGIALVQVGFEKLAGARLNTRPLDAPNSGFSFGVAWRKDDASEATRFFVESIQARC